MGELLHNKIEEWKKRLLDYGKRNRLINFRETKRSNVKITSPSYEDLYRHVVKQGKEISFPLVRNDGVEAKYKTSKDLVETSTNVGDLQQTLRNLRSKVKMVFEEQGVNVLFLAFGLLRWTERDDSNQVLASPLVLVPVKLTLQSLKSPYKLSLLDDEIVVNPTLIQKLSNDIGVDIPYFDSSQEGIREYLDKIEEIAQNNGWSIERCVNLTILSFLKINMYEDLKRNEQRLYNNPIVLAIAREPNNLPELPKDINDYDHDATSPSDTFQVVDADSSQQDAILLSKRGVSFVLQGPPGTGKSQTITNIISEALARGKKVLFVSEKMAALQVVYKRLQDVGLSDFCLTLHSYNANRNEIFEELGRSIQAIQRNNKISTDELDELVRKRAELIEYQKELHKLCPTLNCTMYDINGHLAQLDKVPDYSFKIDNVAEITKNQLDDNKRLLNNLAQTIKHKTIGYDQNPWRGYRETLRLTNYLWESIEYDIRQILPGLTEIKGIQAECIRELCINILPSLTGLDAMIEILKVASASPMTLTRWVYDDKIEDVQNGLAAYRELHESLLQHKRDILKDFDEEILDLAYYPMLQRFRSSYASFMRILSIKYHKDIRLLRSFSREGNRIDYEQARSILQNLKAYHDRYADIHGREALMTELYGSYYKLEDTDWEEIGKAIGFAIKLKALISKIELPENLVKRICEDEATIEYCKRCQETLIKPYDSIKEGLDRIFSLFENPEKFREDSLDELVHRLNDCMDNKRLLEEWIDYKASVERCIEAGLSSYIQQVEEKNIEPDLLVNGYLKRFYRLWLDAVLPQFPAIQNFRRWEHEQTIQDFCSLDLSQFEIARARVRKLVSDRIPDFDSSTARRDDVSKLKGELRKKRRSPLRRLFREIPDLIMTIKPCLMMSPLSVSVYLEAERFNFDLVIFDEASQVRTENAIGAIMRGKQVIIAGDREQLPPTDFFETSLNDDDYDTDDEDDNGAGAYESILDEAAAVLPERSLLWHYRSRHEHLIAFSNAKIYKNRLITFPSTIEKKKNYGVEYIYVEDGIYDRSDRKNNVIGKRDNVKEAQRVADLVFEHIRNDETKRRSLGVVTFSEPQQRAVEAAIWQKRRENAKFESFFAEDKDEAFFIKNLENVQGDERDTIIFSIGYAKDINGRMSMNFGPLSNDKGQRRLNVAITRAKYNVKLVGSIKPEDINIDNVSYDGVKMLRSYIDFAIRGVDALRGELSYSLDPTLESPFEASVYDYLKSEGYEAITQVGCSGFRIDMAIRHPKHSGEFVLGIECDGATYHSSRTARERDRLRQDVLEEMGWTIYRIWSTDWIKNTVAEKKRLINAVEEALAKARVEDQPIDPDQQESSAEVSADLQTVASEEEDSENEAIEVVSPIIPAECNTKPALNKEHRENSFKPKTYETDNMFPDYVYADIDELRKLSKSDAIKRVVEIEQPIHIRELCRRVSPLFDGEETIINQVKELINDTLSREIKIRKSGFVAKIGLKTVMPRRSVNLPRDIKYISKQELIEALRIIASRKPGLKQDDLFKETARELGYGRTGRNIYDSLRKAYKALLKGEVVNETKGKVYPKQPDIPF
ncbi:MAG: DUF4011 domain-containing protein [Clostridia bacterium]|nr:DUF4011 domain-containing protein [Clostridia bacterium]